MRVVKQGKQTGEFNRCLANRNPDNRRKTIFEKITVRIYQNLKEKGLEIEVTFIK